MPEISDEELKALNDAKAERDSLKKAADEAALKEKEKEKEKDLDLNEKVRKEKEELEKKGADSKKIEGALKFNLGVNTFVKEHADLLPGEVPDLLRQAEKENYDNANQKANTLKVAIMQSFFAVKDNLEALTSKQKSALDEYQKLTKNGKEEKAEAIYENIFEPALETMKRVKKAEELGRAKSGQAGGNKSQDSYKNKIMESTQKTYLGIEKGKS